MPDRLRVVCKLATVVLLLPLMLAACQPAEQLQVITFTGPTMGTDYRIKVVLPVSHAVDNLERDIAAELEAVNASMSTYLESSELNQFNRLGADIEFELSEPARVVISEALRISELSHGAFDITVGNAVRLWGFGPDGSISRAPDQQQLEDLALSAGYRKLRLQENRLSKSNALTNIDLSGIAKGYAVDRISNMLTRVGLPDHLVDVGGELRAAGKNIQQHRWRVAIEKPQLASGVQQVIELNNAAIATSGDYRNYLTIEGNKYSHTIDPQTLQPVFHRLASVSVVSDHASTADALATALMVMGEERAVMFAENQGLAAYFIIRSSGKDSFDIKYTQKFTSIMR